MSIRQKAVIVLNSQRDWWESRVKAWITMRKVQLHRFRWKTIQAQQESSLTRVWILKQRDERGWVIELSRMFKNNRKSEFSSQFSVFGFQFPHKRENLEFIKSWWIFTNLYFLLKRVAAWNKDFGVLFSEPFRKLIRAPVTYQWSHLI